MLPLNNTSKWIIGLLIAILLVILASRLISWQIENKNPHKSPEIRLFPTNITSIIAFTNLKILYKQDDDLTGRTVLYQHDMDSTANFSGIGERNKLDNNRLNYITGIVSKWEKIPDSTDYYLTIKNPLINKVIVKTRLVFNPDAYKSQTAEATGFGVENLTSTNKKINGFELLKPLAFYGYERVKNVLDVGDAVIIKPKYTDSNNVYYIKDSNQFLVAQWLIIRRMHGKQDMMMDLN